MLVPCRVKHCSKISPRLQALEELREDVAVVERLCETQRQDVLPIFGSAWRSRSIVH